MRVRHPYRDQPLISCVSRRARRTSKIQKNLPNSIMESSDLSPTHFPAANLRNEQKNQEERKFALKSFAKKKNNRTYVLTAGRAVTLILCWFLTYLEREKQNMIIAHGDWSYVAI